MKKTWSLSTTVRNPERILPFLEALKELEGANFDIDGQVRYQMILIQNRLYKPMHLPIKLEKYYDTLQDKMTFSQAEEIFDFMKSMSRELTKDPGLRGRTSVAPLSKMGLAIAKKSAGKVKITSMGNAFLEGKLDLGDVFFGFLLKWQIPNPDSDDFTLEDGYDVKPFVGTLHLIDCVNRKSIEAGLDAKGLSKQEFSLFAPTLVNYSDIDEYANKILELRGKIEGKNRHDQKDIFEQYRQEFAKDFLQTSERKEIIKLIKNLKDYGDNAIRYFRLTRYLYIRGGGYYVDLEPRRQVEIKNLLAFDSGKSLSFESQNKYLEYLADITKPELPWESKSEFIEIANELVDDIKAYEIELSINSKVMPAYNNFEINALKDLANELRKYRRLLQEKKNHLESQDLASIVRYTEALDNIFNEEDRPIALEKYTALSLHALNDAIRIQPNYPVGDDNEPTFTAPSGKPDIECYYDSFNSICEVTMLTGRSQWYNEGQPIMRHLRDFEDRNVGKDSYCIFIAPKIHRDTLNTFWFSVRYEYEGSPQRIIPLSINDFNKVVRTLISLKQCGKSLKHQDLLSLYNNIILSSKKSADANEWLNGIPTLISSWQCKVEAL